MQSSISRSSVFACVTVVVLVASVRADTSSLPGFTPGWFHSAGSFTVSGRGQWTESGNGGVKCDFREVNRDANFVTLFDRNRDCTICLGQSASFIRFGNGRLGRGDFEPLYQGGWKNGDIPTSIPGFYYDGGAFLDMEGGKWEERTGGVTYHFRETKREFLSTGEIVYLFDASRNIRVYLHRDWASIAGANEDYRPLCKGLWR